VTVPGRQRFVMVRNLQAAERDAHTRDRLVGLLESRIDGSDALDPDARAELRGRIREKPGLWRYLRVTKSGLLRIDRAKIAAEAKTDGRTLLRTSDLTWTPPTSPGATRPCSRSSAGSGTSSSSTCGRSTTGVRPDRRPRAAVLARAAADPHRRDRRRRHLAQPLPHPGRIRLVTLATEAGHRRPADPPGRQTSVDSSGSRPARTTPLPRLSAPLEDAVHFDPHRDSAQTWLLTRVHQRAMDELRSVDGTDDPLTAMIEPSASVSLP
jgi:hypothetical protein